jgi:serine/threonine-protein kinase
MSGPELNLRQIVQNDGPLDFESASRYAAEIANQLAVRHSNGQFYQNVHPGKVFLNETGSAQLLHFPECDTEDLDEITEVVSYLAPEQAVSSHGVDGRADIYSLGCTLYYMLVGRPPFANGSISERLLSHQTPRPDAISSLRPETPHSLAQICEKMMAKKPENRYHSAEAVVEALETW